VAFKEVQAAGSLYPTVGMNCRGAAVTFNLGGEPSRKFAYDLSSYPHIGPGFIGCLTRTPIASLLPVSPRRGLSSRIVFWLYT
jgi:hypothetical protein